MEHQAHEDDGETKNVQMDMIPSPDSKNDSITHVEKYDKNSSGVTSPFNLLELEIVEKVCKMLSNRDLLHVRPVSTMWDVEACCNLLKRADSSGLKTWSFSENMSDSEVNKLCALLSKSTSPDILLKNVIASSEWDRPTGIPGCENLLKDFGRFFTRMEIHNDPSDLKSVLRKLLGQEDSYCPNVEVLHYYTYTSVPYNDDDQPSEPSEPTKLKEVYFISLEDSWAGEFGDLSHILEKSPQLTTLHIDSSDSEEAGYATVLIFSILENCPHINLNLSTLTVQGYILPLLEDLCLDKFSKLTRVKLVHKFDDFDIDVANGDNEDLMGFLEHVSQSLEIFEVEIDEQLINEIDDDEPKPFRGGFPFMPKLKELYLKNYHLDLNDEPDFLKNAPSLKILKLFSLSHFQEFLELNVQYEVVQNNLEKIDLDENDWNNWSPVLIQSLGQVLPNWMEIYINVSEVICGHSADEVSLWFEQFCQAILKMRQLKRLEVNFLTMDQGDSPYDGGLDLTKSFGILKLSPSLEYIGFYRSTDYFKYKYNILEEKWLVELLDVPKLREIEFDNFTMGDETDKKMVEVFAKQNIMLSFNRSDL